MTRVLFLTPWFPNVPGDREGNFIFDSAAALRRAGVDIAVLVVRPWVRKSLGQERYRALSREFDARAFGGIGEVRLAQYLSVPGNRLPRLSAWLHDRAVAGPLKSLARSFKPTHIHAHTEGEGPVAAAVARSLGLPAVVTLHGINTAPRYFGSAYRRARIGAALVSADRVVLVGKPLESFFATIAGNTRNFEVIPNGFDPPAVIARAIGTEAQLGFISVSNLHEGKGIDVALKALAKARAAGLEDFRYTVVGDGAEREGLVRLAAQLGLEDKVHFAGACPHNRVYSFLAKADVFVLPSYREAFGVAYLEAMAAGLLAIGVEGEGPSAFIRDGETGFLIPPRDPDRLADRLRAVARDRPRMQAIAAAGQVHVMQSLTWDHHAQRLMQVYRSVDRPPDAGLM